MPSPGRYLGLRGVRPRVGHGLPSRPNDKERNKLIKHAHAKGGEAACDWDSKPTRKLWAQHADFAGYAGAGARQYEQKYTQLYRASFAVFRRLETVDPSDMRRVCEAHAEFVAPQRAYDRGGPWPTACSDAGVPEPAGS